MSGSRLPGDSATNDRHKSAVRAETRLSGDIAERFAEFRETHGTAKSQVLRDALDAYLPDAENSMYLLPSDPELKDAYLALAGEEKRTMPVDKAEDILARTTHTQKPKRLIRDDVLDALQETPFVGVSWGTVAVAPLTPREQIVQDGDSDE